MIFESLKVVAHADWSKYAAKRRVAIAAVDRDGSYHAYATQAVTDPNALLRDLSVQAGNAGSVLVGFDFPIGLPHTYAKLVGIERFLLALDEFGGTEWPDFYHVAATIEEIYLKRPFYPDSPGGRRRQHLSSRLGISFDGLYRQCEKAHPGRNAACPLFWTLGGQQVGKAAISGWQEVLASGLKSKTVDIWPFSGRLAELLKPGRLVAVETYPAEFYGPLGIRSPQRRFSKRDPSDRRESSSALLAAAEKSRITLEPSLREEIEGGFGVFTDGDDRFDALTGLFGMVQTLSGWDDGQEALTEELRHIEGWIFGQRILPPPILTATGS